jgi:hypothetical protein
MSLEQTPTYHYPDHLRAYDIEAPKKAWGQIAMLTEMLDDILYAGKTTIQPHSARASEDLFESFFVYEYPRSESTITGLAATPEFLKMSVEHARYLGSAALKQSYKVRLDSSIRHMNLGIYRITSMYYLEEVAGIDNKYLGSMLKPNIIGEAQVPQEPMTVYDCETLSKTFDEVLDLIKVDQEYHQSSR